MTFVITTPTPARRSPPVVVPALEPDGNNQMKNFMLSILAGSIAIICPGCSKHEPDIRTREWILPQGESVRFSHEDPGFFGSDHYKYLKVRLKDGKINQYSFAGGHSGYNEVDLFLDSSQTKIWLVDRSAGSVGAFLDLSTGSFAGEGLTPPILPNSSSVKSP